MPDTSTFHTTSHTAASAQTRSSSSTDAEDDVTKPSAEGYFHTIVEEAAFTREWPSRFLATFHWLQENCWGSRLIHSLSVMHASLKIAKLCHVDALDAVTIALAGMVHDVARLYSPVALHSYFRTHPDLHLEATRSLEAIQHSVEDEPAPLLHPWVGAHMCETYMSEAHPKIVEQLGEHRYKALHNAIRFHTTGHPTLSMIAQIVYLADKIEPNTRPYPYVQQAWDVLESPLPHASFPLEGLQFRLDCATVVAIEASLIYLQEKGLPAHPFTPAWLEALKQRMQAFHVKNPITT